MARSLPRRLLPLLLAAGLASACDQSGSQSSHPVKLDTPPPKLKQLVVEPRPDYQKPHERTDLLDPKTGAVQQDLYNQNDGRVDILFIVDDSGSMADKRARLADNFDKFFQTLQTLKSDYQIGVTSTNLLASGDQGHLRGTTKIITNLTLNAQQEFRNAVTFPASRVALDQGLDAMVTALSSPLIDPGGPNAGLLRPGAALGVIVVSDGVDHSFGYPDYYARWLLGAKGPGNEELVSFSIIVGDLPDGCTPAGEEFWVNSHAPPAVRYHRVKDAVGGTEASICAPDFTKPLIDIAKGSVTLRRRFPLSLKPLIGTISVFVDNGRIAENDQFGWHYDALTNTVEFKGDYVPPPRSQIRIVYLIKT